VKMRIKIYPPFAPCFYPLGMARGTE